MDIVLRRAARLGNGWMATLPPDQFNESVIKLNAYLEQTDRDLNDFGISNHIYLAETPEDEWHNLLNEWRDLNVTHVEFSLMGTGLKTIDEYIAALLRFREVVGV